jgi:hypothetical protein
MPIVSQTCLRPNAQFFQGGGRALNGASLIALHALIARALCGVERPDKRVGVSFTLKETMRWTHAASQHRDCEPLRVCGSGFAKVA